MFKNILALNTYSEPFLSMKAAEQRNIIEQLLGITQLSEKSDALKEQIKITKDSISTENTKIETIKASNDRIQQSIEALERKQKMWEEQYESSLENLRKSIDHLNNIDIDNEIELQKSLDNWRKAKKEKDSIDSMIAKQTAAIEKEQRVLERLEKEILSLEKHKCHACGQDVHDSKHEEMVLTKGTQIQESINSVSEMTAELTDLIEAKRLIGELGICPSVFYDNLEQALNHKSTLAGLEKDLIIKEAETNPYAEQIIELKKTAVQDIDWNAVNDLTTLKDHQEFLYKLLTNKDSFVRKRIIDQNLAFLNQRLTYYLDKIGLPHIVEFQNDLTVIITQLGQDLDFDNLSRGERNRLILSLSWAFRDVWENLYHPINLLFIDELVDSGMDASGVEASIAVLKKMTRERNKNIFLISHRDDLTNRVNHVLKVIKENGFTSYSNDVEIVQ
jgi:DNA repair exonuclease SbcCD ATPase subunit